MRRMLVMSALTVLGGWAADTPITGERLLASAQAILRINNPVWLDQEATRFATTIGQDPSPLRGIIARMLYRSTSLDGIDLTRPALLAWRSGPAPLLAVLPIRDRRTFIARFGQGDESPMVRIGEREGTTVYSQNGAKGLSEYRLMVSEGTAYLARTAAECRALISTDLPRTTSSIPLSFTARSTWMQDVSASLLATSPIHLPQLDAVRQQLSQFNQLGGGFIDQLNEVSLDLRPDGTDSICAGLRIRAKSDSLLAVWIGNQRNQPSRLLPIVRTPDTAISIAGQVTWQGLGERIGAALAGPMKMKAGTAWSDAVDESWNALWMLSDRSGPFAAAINLTIDKDKDGKPAVGREFRMMVEQRRAAEVLNHTNTVMGALVGAPGGSITVRSMPGYKWQPLDQDDASAATVAVATDRHLIQTQSSVRPAEQVAADLVERSLTNVPPDPLNALVMASINVTPFAMIAAMYADHPIDVPLQPTPLTVTLRVASPTDLQGDLTIPHIRIATLGRDLGLTASGGKLK